MLRFSMATAFSGPTVLSHRYGRLLLRFAPKCLAMVVRANSAPLLWTRNCFLLFRRKAKQNERRCWYVLFQGATEGLALPHRYRGSSCCQGEAPSLGSLGLLGLDPFYLWLQKQPVGGGTGWWFLGFCQLCDANSLFPAHLLKKEKEKFQPKMVWWYTSYQVIDKRINVFLKHAPHL